MFDDHTSQPVGGAIPPNLPIGDPEDIFANVDASPGPLPVNPQPVAQDAAPMAEQPKTALSAGILKPKEEPVYPSQAPIPAAAPVEKPIPAAPPKPAKMPPPAMNAVPPAVETYTLPTDAPEMYAIKEPKASRGIITAIIIIVVLLVLLGGGFFLYTQFVSTPTYTTVPVDNTFGSETDVESDTSNDLFQPVENIVVDELDTIDDIGTTTATDGISDADSDILFGSPVDTDADGLDDDREDDIGTDSAHWDTDGDELSDGDEVIIWKSDPLNPDTDGDGFFDGAEIKNGYSPTGPGKIFEPPTSVPSNTTSVSSTL